MHDVYRVREMSTKNNVERQVALQSRGNPTRLNRLLMVSLIRTNWINVQEFVLASVLAGEGELRMEEIKENKRDLYVREAHVCAPT